MVDKEVGCTNDRAYACALGSEIYAMVEGSERHCMSYGRHAMHQATLRDDREYIRFTV